MVFEHLTLVELHLENSRFTAPGGSEEPEGAAEAEEAATEAAPEEAEEGGRGLRGPLMFLVLLGVALGLVARRRRRSAEGPSEAEQISIEQATEQ